MDSHRQSLIPTLLTEQLERVANRALDYAPVTRLQLRKLAGKSLAIELQRPHFPLLVSVTRKGVVFYSHWDGGADVTLRGPAVALLRQLREDNPTPASLMCHGIELEGDQALARQFINLLRDLDIDLESALGDLIGDVAAHQAVQVARSGLDWLGRVGKSLLQQSRQLLAEERKVVVSTHQFDEFRSQVEQLREDTDRLEARLQLLRERLQPQPAPSDAHQEVVKP